MLLEYTLVFSFSETTFGILSQVYETLFGEGVLHPWKAEVPRPGSEPVSQKTMPDVKPKRLPGNSFLRFL